ncbi:uncharacterized protein LOC111917882 [Lactuca sativa]|uniref:uncharacterized protein LOC111917882 n=1 Tax=Lactuca sativa TaxID=4236 RepID=UPI000CD8BCE8|nr:uncharacterized protein LOC111917882 [Lactuca sativa]
MARSFWGNYSFMHAFSPSRAASGGILAIWDVDLISHNHVSVHDGFVVIEAVWVRSGLQVNFIVVYAPQGLSKKRLLWIDIYNFISNSSGECIIMGDFNEVRDESERMGSKFYMFSARVFNDFINSLNLVDVPLGGPRFTWSDKWGSKFSKLDRFLVTEGFLEFFPHLSAMVLDKNIPDRRPILLLEHRVDYGPTPFRIFHSWFDMEGFDDIVRETWATSVVDLDLTNPWVIFKKKLQFLKSKIREWNSKHWDMAASKRKNLQDLVEPIDVRLMEDEGSATLREQRVSLLKEISDLDHLAQVDLAQKAKIQWGHRRG